MAVAVRFNDQYAQSAHPAPITSGEIKTSRRFLELTVMLAYFCWLGALTSALPSWAERGGFCCRTPSAG